MPTRRRRESITGMYHVIARGINKEKTFNQQREKIYFKKIILKHLERYKVEFYAYCIMSNHVHFIVRAEIQELSLFMAGVLAEYAVYYNFKHHRNGHVFQNRFISECIETERYFWNCLRYIHLNPVKAGMVKQPLRYAHSSMGEYRTGETVILHEKALVMYRKKFGDFEQFIQFHEQRQSEIFSDLPDEMEAQRQEVALLIAEEIFKEYNLSLLNQVFEEKTIREEYILRVKNLLKISGKKAKELCVILLNKVENE